MNKNTKLEFILEKFLKARENDIFLYREYLKEFYCDNSLEKEVIDRVLENAP
jgi:hypothetical protein